MKAYYLLLSLAWLLAILIAPTHGAEPRKFEAAVGNAKGDDQLETLEFFEAIGDGRIEVRFIPKDATQATMIIKNKGDQAVNVRPPAAFGAVHVLGQFGGMGMGGMGGGMGGMGGGMGMGGMGMGGMGMGGMGGGQGMGGGMGGMGGMGMGGMGMGGMGGGMGGMGGGMFRVAADKPTKLTVPCVCLEHGKKDPNPRMIYKVVPIEQINADPRVSELCSLLGQGRIAQNTAQASAWHLANGLSWEQLAMKNRVESQYTGNIRFFSPGELQAAYQAANTISHFYAEKTTSSSRGSSASYQGEESQTSEPGN